MAVFIYKARNEAGITVTGAVEASTARRAAQLLIERAMFVIDIREKRGALGILNRFQKVGFGEIVSFTRQLSTMVNAGLALPEAFSILRLQSTNQTFSSVLQDLEHNIVGGANLADSLNRYPQYFSGIYVALVKAGEASGKLDKVLLNLANTLEAQKEFRNKITGAMVYPAIVIAVTILVVIFLMIVVIPQLTSIYVDFGIELPWTTLLLVSIYNLFAYSWWMLLIAGAAGLYIFNSWRKTETGTHVIDKFTLSIPLYGTLMRQIILVDFTRTLSMLISSGIHILEGLKVLRNTLNNVYFREAVDEISKRIEKGLALGESFSQFDVFPPLVSQMAKVGEETGKLDETLMKVAQYFQTESEHSVKNLTTAIEPAFLIVLAVIVGFIVFSVMIPIYSLTSSIK